MASQDWVKPGCARWMAHLSGEPGGLPFNYPQEHVGAMKSAAKYLSRVSITAERSKEEKRNKTCEDA